MFCWLEEVHQVTKIDLKLLKGLEGCHDAHALAVFKIGWRINGGVVWVCVLQGAPHLVVGNSEIDISFSLCDFGKEWDMNTISSVINFSMRYVHHFFNNKFKYISPNNVKCNFEIVNPSQITCSLSRMISAYLFGWEDGKRNWKNTTQTPP